jgi:2-succinyl-5-enolpyruvyl-6-hydroxy-3-cyclohexene-1-carboxylate synthase
VVNDRERLGDADADAEAEAPHVDAGTAAASDVDAQTSFVRTVVDEWVRAGLADAVVAPGSRNTPLSLALTGDGRVRVHVHVDERSAGFLALGLAKATRRPTVLVCTSGSAAANLHPAVVEADHGAVSLVVCTADRPWELHDTGAPQTMRQHGLYGSAVRWASDVPAPVWDGRRAWRSVAARAFLEATGSPGRPPGPVHLNLELREPLMPTGAPAPIVEGRPDGAPWVSVSPIADAAPPSAAAAADVVPVARSVAGRAVRDGRALPGRGLLVLGAGAAEQLSPDDVSRFAARSGWPVLADAISGLRCVPASGAGGAGGDVVGVSGVVGVISSYEALVRLDDFADRHRPEIVVRVGAPLTSKVATRWLADVPHVVVGPWTSWVDPTRSAIEHVVGDAGTLLSTVAVARPDPGWAPAWSLAHERALEAIDATLAGFGDEPFEGRVARDVAAAVPDRGTLVVASSMPVRDLEWFMRPRSGLRIVANRGLNGIDGFVSTVVGVALGSPGRATVGLCGDLAFLHDANGLLGAVARGVDAVVVVVDNDGGGIFSFLPQADLDDQALFETLWGTPHGVDLVALAAVHGVTATTVGAAGAVSRAVAAACAAGGVHVIVVPTDRTGNVERHRMVWDDVRRALEPSAPPVTDPVA